MNYSRVEWKNIRNIILKRDNFTCQKCSDFNPQLGEVEFSIEGGEYVEIHQYVSFPNLSKYTISSEKNKLTIELDFDENWLVLPILQVHHKKYIKGRMPWDYENEDLITLCKNCHKTIHLENRIPVYDRHGNLIEKKLFIPKDDGEGKIHDYPTWQFIKKGKKNKEYINQSKITPKVTYFLPDEQNREVLDLVVDKMIKDFFTIFLKSK